MATVIFLTPHPDDETLSLGAAIRRHLEVTSPTASGEPAHDVHVLSLCDGSGSGAQRQTSLDDAEFVAARDDELRRACRALGVPPSNLHLPTNRAPAGHLTIGWVADLIEDLVLELRQRDPAGPPPALKSYTDLPVPHPSTGGPRHPDHVASGAAARQLLRDGVVGSLRLYVEPWLRDAFRTAHPGVTLSADRPRDPTGADRVRRALDEYADVDPLPDPAAARHGVGYLSVGNLFPALRADPVSWYHLP